MIEKNRGRSFWMGLIVGVGVMLVAAAILWFLGVIDVFPSDKEAQNTTQNNVANEESNEVENEIENEDNDVANDTEEESNNTTNDTEDKDLTRTGENVTLTLAKAVDDSANPVDPTNQFTGDDDKFYVVVEFDDRASLGEKPTVTVAWYKDGDKLTDFDYELPDDQSRIYFFQNNAGEGEYEVAILVDGDEIDRESFSVTE